MEHSMTQTLEQVMGTAPEALLASPEATMPPATLNQRQELAPSVGLAAIAAAVAAAANNPGKIGFNSN